MTGTDEGHNALVDRYEEIHFYVADLGRQLVSFAAPPAGARLLDVGAGCGAVTRAALACGCAVTAVDASAGMVSRLAADFPEVIVRQQDASSLGFPAGSFDVVTAGFMVRPAAALAEFRRVLAPGGTVAVALERHEVARLGWLHELNRSYFGDREGRSPLAADELDELLLSAGFTSPTRVAVRLPKRLPDPAALWDWLALQGVPAALDALPTDEAVAFREQFFRNAERTHRNGGTVLEFAATLHRATAP